MEYIYLALLTCIFIFGLIELLELISRKMIYKRRDFCTKKIIIIPISGHIEDIEFFVRGLLNEKRWGSVLKCSKLVLADVGLDEETRKICKILCEENEEISLSSNDELISLLDGKV